MAELLIRVGGQDASLISRVLAGPEVGRPHRVVADADVALAHPQLSASASRAGVPFVVDPQTFYYQDHQHAADAWARLPFGRPEVLTPGDLLRPGVADAIAQAVLEYQLGQGATILIPPYAHVGRPDDGWPEAQAALWRATRRYVDGNGIALPILALVALGWRLLPRLAWPAALTPLEAQLDRLEPREIALAASKVDAGSKPEDRLASLVAVIRRLSRRAPVIAWNQGVLGEAAVAAGAIGYESGIGWRERCDLGAAMRSRRAPSPGGGQPRPIYIGALGRSIPKRSVEGIVRDGRLTARITCLDSGCCPGGRGDLLSDQRSHAIAARRRRLERVSTPDQAPWRWHVLARDVREALDLAARINNLHENDRRVARFDASALNAVLIVADHRRQASRRRPAA